MSTEKNGGKVVQAVHHANTILGVQFPESVGTKGGAVILRAFLEM